MPGIAIKDKEFYNVATVSIIRNVLLRITMKTDIISTFKFIFIDSFGIFSFFYRQCFKFIWRMYLICSDAFFISRRAGKDNSQLQAITYKEAIVCAAHSVQNLANSTFTKTTPTENAHAT